MEVSGRIIQVLPEVNGEGRNGGKPWKKQEFILETTAQYPKKVCFSLWGDRVDQFRMNVGEEVIISVDPESREYNGRWYTELRAWKVVRKSQMDGQSGGQSYSGSSDGGSNSNSNSYNQNNVEDDLPF
jgi:hypothetical protein